MMPDMSRGDTLVWLLVAGLLSSHEGAMKEIGAFQRDGTPPRTAPAALPVFEDISKEAGLDFQHTNGASPEEHMVETMGSGGLFFDYGYDGWLDIFLVDGGSVVDRAT
jgi:hypothetical protein